MSNFHIRQWRWRRKMGGRNAGVEVAVVEEVGRW
jgi:hypothetical protein